ALLALAAARGLPLVDMFAITAGAGLIGEDPRSWMVNPANGGRTDGVHPTSDGYRAIASAFAAAVLALTPRPQRIVCLGDSITFGQGVPGEGTAGGETYPGWLARILAAAG
ncbi:MAG: SGNH/GDSL hydrolase family protein, partial [Planctomycetes bacterium]|nr:SGNH/GDSL hydrolase family protein [Planctomycetota bacterium]